MFIINSRHQLKKFELRVKQKKNQLEQNAWLNIQKAAFPVSPIDKFLTHRNPRTSTPQNLDHSRICTGSAVSKLNFDNGHSFSLQKQIKNANLNHSDSNIQQQSVFCPNITIDSSCCSIDINHPTDKIDLEDHSKKDINYHIISLSSTSSDVAKCSSKTTTIQDIDNPRNTVKAKVGFNTSNIDESEKDESKRIVIKGGKWRRTIFEIRKNKKTLCKCGIQSYSVHSPG